MRVKQIEIDGFGAWTGLKLEELPADALVIYGPNEAGKTTLMQFIRTVLYGFSSQRRLRYLPPAHGGTPGGRLLVSDPTGEYICQRHVSLDSTENDRGELTITDSQNRPRGPEKLAELLASIDETTFQNVFALGLREIQELSSLDDTAAADHLYKLTSGLDRVSLVDVAREVTQSRARLLSEEKNGEILKLIERREKLQAEINQLTAAGKKWAELASERTALAEEAAALEESIEKSDASSRLIEAALDIQAPWEARQLVERELRAMGEVKPLPENALQRLEELNQRIIKGRKQLKRIAIRRKQLEDEAESLQINKLLLNQAPRIEALNEHSQWIITLDQQILKLSDEIAKIELDIENQLGGAARKQGVDANNLEQMPKDALSILRRPAALVREASEALEKARREAEAARREAEAVAAQVEAAGREKRIPDVNKAIKATGEKVALLRRRIQIEERLDALSRRAQELDFDGEESQMFEGVPLRRSIPIGAMFAFGSMLCGIGIFGNTLDIVETGTPWGILGGIVLVGGVMAKLFLDRQADEAAAGSNRQIEQLRHQMAEARRERDELDAKLPPGGGALDARLREAEAELRELEKLVPLNGERDSIESRRALAERRLAEAQDGLKEAKSRWRTALRSVGLPEDFALSQVKAVLKEAGNVAELRRKRDARIEELEQRKRELLVLTTRIQQLMADVRLTPKSDKPQAMLHQIAQAWAGEKQLVEQRAAALAKAKKYKRMRFKKMRAIKSATRHRQQLLTLAGVSDQQAFRKLAADYERFLELQQKHIDLSNKIRTALTGRCSEEAVSNLLTSEAGDLQKRWNKRVAHLQDIRARLSEIHKRQGVCTAEMAALAADRRLADASLELTMVEEQLRKAARRWQVLTLVSRGLEAVRKSYETNRQPQTLRDASAHLQRLTLGQYRRIWMPLDRQILLVEDIKGQTLSLDVLSRGTREAVYIALRLALVATFARRGARIPLVLDDVLVNFDAARVRAAAEVFRDFASEGYQLIFFTCHDHIRQLFESLGVEIRSLPARATTEMPTDLPPVIETKRPKRRKAEPKPEPVVELPPPPPPPVVPEEVVVPRLPAVDPNLLFAGAASEEEWYDPTNAYEFARKPKPVELPKLPDYWPIAELPAPSKPPKPKRRVAPPAPQPVLEYKLPDFWPIAEPPPPAPPTPSYEVISFRYPVPEPPPKPAPRIVLPPPPPPPPRPVVLEPLPEPVAVELPPPPPPPPPRREKPVKQPAPPVVEEKPAPVAVAPRPERRRRFTWESPEMYWEDHQRHDQNGNGHPK